MEGPMAEEELGSIVNGPNPRKKKISYAFPALRPKKADRIMASTKILVERKEGRRRRRRRRRRKKKEEVSNGISRF